MSTASEVTRSHWLSFSLCIAMAATSAQAENRMLYLGGGGDPANEQKTIFDSSLEAMVTNLRSAGWRADVRFNGGHPQSEALLRQLSQSPNVDSTNRLTAQTFRDAIRATTQEYEARIRDGRLAPGDQLMVVVDSHGINAKPREVSHSIAVGPSTDLSGMTPSLRNTRPEDMVSMDELAPLIALAQRSGLKLAIVDLSCRSGNSQRLVASLPPSSTPVCLVSASGPEEYAWSSFSSAFSERLKPGASLEDIFVQARSVQSEPSFPMISSQAGRLIADQLYRILQPELRLARDGKADNLSEDLLKIAQSCTDERDRMPEIIREISILQLAVGSQMLDTKALETALRKYHDARQAWVRDLRGKGMGPELQRREKFEGEASYSKGGKSAVERMNIDYTWEQLATLKLDEIAASFRKSAAEAKDPQSRASAQATELMVRKAALRQKELLSQYPALAKVDDERKQAVQRLYQTTQLAREVAQEERKLYQRLYESSAAQTADRSNPCKNFRF